MNQRSDERGVKCVLGTEKSQAQERWGAGVCCRNSLRAELCAVERFLRNSKREDKRTMLCGVPCILLGSNQQ